MITIKRIHRAKTEQEFEEFIKSLVYSNSGENPFEMINNSVVIGASQEIIDKISWVDNPSADSWLTIDLPDDCLVLGNAWDKYIKHALDNGLPQYGRGKNYVPNWENYVQTKMGLQSRRPPEGIFPDLKVTLASQ